MRLTKTTNVRSFLFDNDYWQAFYQDNSAVTRGSSGGALFDANNRIAGQLYKGWTSCLTSGYSDRYGKFSSSWNGGGTLDTRLSDWLSPNQMLLTTDLFDPTTVAIVGSDIISCTNNTQYSLNYNLFDVSYVWEWSSNIQYVSGQGTPTLTVSPLPGSNTQGFIKVTITSIKGISRSLVRTKTVYSGPPTISASYNYNGNVVPMQIYSGSSSFNPVCNLQQTNTAMQISGASSVYWSKLTSNPTSVSWTQNGNDLSFYLWSLGQTAVFRIEATNICGTASYDFGFQSVNCGSGGGGCAKYAVTNGDKSTLRVVVPNIPAPCRLASMNKDSSRKEEIIEWVKIYDMSGRLRIHQKFADTKSATVNTFSLLPGVYIIEISDGKNIERQKVVIIK